MAVDVATSSPASIGETSQVGQAYLRGADGELKVVAASDGVDQEVIASSSALKVLLTAKHEGNASLSLISEQGQRYLVHRNASEIAFAHVLTDLPWRITFREAVDAWGSHFWRSQESDATNLPRLSLPLPAGRWALSDVNEYAADPAHQRLLRFLIDALLTTSGQVSIVIAASSSDVAGAIATLGMIFPRPLLDALTFCTAIGSALHPLARIVGFTAGGPLPDEAFAGRFVAFDPVTGHASSVSATAYAHHVCSSIANGNWEPIQQINSVCQTLNISDPALLPGIFAALVTAPSLTARDIAAAVADPAIGRWFARQPGVLARVPEAVLEDLALAQVVEQVLDAAGRENVSVEQMLDAAIERGILALAGGDDKALTPVLQVILPRISPAAIQRFAARLAGRPVPERMSIKTRSMLLPAMVQYCSTVAGAEELLRPWLLVGAAELWSILQSNDLPETIRVAAARQAILRDQGVALSAATVLARDPHLTIAILRTFGQGSEELTAGGNAFHTVIAAKGGKPVVDALMDLEAGVAPELIDRCLLPLMQQERLTALDLTLDYHRVLVRQLGRTQTLSELFVRLTAQSSIRGASRRNQKIVARFIKSVAGDRSVREDIRQRAAACLSLQQFTRRGSIRYETIVHLAESVALCADQHLAGATAAAVLDRAAQVLLRSRRYQQVDAARLAIEGVVVALCRLPQAHAALLFREMLARLSRRRRFWSRPALVTAMIEIACGQGLALPLTRHDLKQPRHEIAEHIARHSRLYDFVDHRATLWQEEPLKIWRALKKTYPPSWKHRVVDSTLAAFKIVALALGAAGIALLVNAFGHR